MPNPNPSTEQLKATQFEPEASWKLSVKPLCVKVPTQPIDTESILRQLTANDLRLILFEGLVRRNLLSTEQFTRLKELMGEHPGQAAQPFRTTSAGDPLSRGRGIPD